MAPIESTNPLKTAPIARMILVGLPGRLVEQPLERQFAESLGQRQVFVAELVAEQRYAERIRSCSIEIGHSP